MLYTLADARQVCRPHVDGGSCSDELVDARINEAISRVLDTANWYEIQRTMRVSVCRSCIALPSFVETVISVNSDGNSAYVFNAMYQFVHTGPGDFNSYSGGSGYKDLADLGDHFQTMFDIPTSFENPLDRSETIEPGGMNLVAFSTIAADAGKRILVKGTLANGEATEEEVVIVRWKNGVEGTIDGAWGDARLPISSTLFNTADRVIKPLTQGYITLLAVHTDTSAIFGLAKYAPGETATRFRRYHITNASAATANSLQLRVRLRFVPLVAASDLIPFEQLHTVKLAVMGISEENAKNWTDAQTAFASAIGLLNKREEAKVTASGNPVLVDSMARSSYAHSMRGMGRI